MVVIRLLPESQLLASLILSDSKDGLIGADVSVFVVREARGVTQVVVLRPHRQRSLRPQN